MKKYLNKWFNLDFNGVTRRAKCVDIEFQTGFGPVFLMETNFGNKFWLTKRELKEQEIVIKIGK